MKKSTMLNGKTMEKPLFRLGHGFNVASMYQITRPAIANLQFKQLCPQSGSAATPINAINAINSPDHLTVLWKCGSNEPVSIWGSKTTKFETVPLGDWLGDENLCEFNSLRTWKWPLIVDLPIKNGDFP